MFRNYTINNNNVLSVISHVRRRYFHFSYKSMCTKTSALSILYTLKDRWIDTSTQPVRDQAQDHRFYVASFLRCNTDNKKTK